MDTKHCYIGPEISEEEFVPEHIFVYLIKGILFGYDGKKSLTLKPDEACLIRKNNLARYNKQKTDNKYQKMVIIFDEIFLKKFHQKHAPCANTLILLCHLRFFD